MRNIKSFCSIHCYNFNGSRCPFCEKDRIHNLTRKFYKELKPVVKVNETKDITTTDLDRLKLKFQGHL